ncbi:TetR family transcriptional regulator [Achromobacter sp. UMC46]|uniref:TetR family transcriptional regulator n=1 Tax=Achromobacter sp. UMC46 TaxID=1862319 RepID=UPI002103CBE9|nr:TetR family transcriptional regulator [Achromobacter sp. UMC46]MBB1592969.1 hypothetical protein [Achromobacter sp. UMC46]
MPAQRRLGDEGTDALTLGRHAEKAGISKPVVYDNFGMRNGLLAELYQGFNLRQTAIIGAADSLSHAAVAGEITEAQAR